MSRRARPRRVALIVAGPQDIHAAAVAAEIVRQGDGEVAVLDSADFPTQWRLSTRFGANADGMVCEIGRDGWRVEDHELAGVWWRRPNRHRVDSSVRDRRARRFCRDEAAAMFQGWLLSLGRRVLNPIGLEYMADRKAHQLHQACRLGLTTPETLITSDPEAAKAFLARFDGKAVFKVLTGTRWRFTETRRFEADHAALLETLPMAPAIFQELVPADRHIRATLVDGQLFCCTVRPLHPGAQIDWRLDLAAEIEPHVLPEAEAAGLVRLMAALGLRYGAIDLILRPDGAYVFLEVNPSGQFLFAEIHAGLPISAAIARALLDGPPAG